MHCNRIYSKHTSLEVMNYEIGGYFGQRRCISKKVNANMFSWKIIIVGLLNRHVHLWYWLKFNKALLVCYQINEVYNCIETADSESAWISKNGKPF